MKVTHEHPSKTVHTGSYSTAIEVDGWIFVSGQGPLNLSTGEVFSGSIEMETQMTLDNLEAILNAAGCSLSDVVKCTVHLSDITDFNAFDVAYAGYFAGAHPLPARTTVQSVLWGGIKVEIDAIARRPEGSRS